VFIEEALLQQQCGNKVLEPYHQGVTGQSSWHLHTTTHPWNGGSARQLLVWNGIRMSVVIVLHQELFHCHKQWWKYESLKIATKIGI